MFQLRNQQDFKRIANVLLKTFPGVQSVTLSYNVNRSKIYIDLWKTHSLSNIGSFYSYGNRYSYISDFCHRNTTKLISSIEISYVRPFYQLDWCTRVDRNDNNILYTDTRRTRNIYVLKNKLKSMAKIANLKEIEIRNNSVYRFRDKDNNVFEMSMRGSNISNFHGTIFFD